MTPEDRSKIEELKKSLYSRTAPDIRQKRRVRFAPEDTSDVQQDWQHPEDGIEPRVEEKHGNFFTRLLVGSIIFFIVALSIGAYYILNGSNTISANNIAITINGPVTIAAGEPVAFDIQVANKNNIKLQSVDLAVDFPAGSVDASDRAKELKQYRETMQDIEPGGVGQKRVNAVIYGEENSKKEIVVTVSYKVAGSNAVFEKEKTYEVLISSSPLTLSVASFKEVTAGQEFDVEVTIASNSSNVIKNLLLRVEYPFGFTLTSADVKAEGNRSVWKVGDIAPHSKKVIKFRGQLEGQDGEARNFRFTVGAASIKSPGVIATEYVAAQQEVAIQKPFISAGIAFENDDGSGEHNSTFGAPVRTTISWFNNLPTAIIDGEVTVKLSGTAFDKASVIPNAGYYKSAENSIVWNKITTPGLGSLGAGESGTIDFTFTPRNFSTASRYITNPYVTIEVNVSGKRLSESNVPESVISSSRRTVKISTALSLNSSVSRSTGPFENTGPIPPRAEKQTTYTITWTADNTVNAAYDAAVRALLPVHVKWLGKTSPTGEDISYNSSTGEVVWRIGSLDAFTTETGKTRRVSFQIALEPSVAQVNQAPSLVQDTTLTAVDDYTGVLLTVTKPMLTTNFSSDPSFKSGQDIVQP